MLHNEMSIFAREPAKLPSSLDEFSDDLLLRALAFFPLSKDYIRSLAKEDQIQIICDFLKIPRNTNPVAYFDCATHEDFLVKVSAVAKNMDAEEKRRSGRR